MAATSSANTGHKPHTDHDHSIPLWGLFLALVALTAAEVGLFEAWNNIEALKQAIPKYTVVILILLFTLPKALIVLIFFMHIKFEKQLIVFLAVLPFMMTLIAVLPMLADTKALKPSAYNDGGDLANYKLQYHSNDHDEPAHAEQPAATPAIDQPPAPDPDGFVFD